MRNRYAIVVIARQMLISRIPLRNLTSPIAMMVPNELKAAQHNANSHLDVK